MRPAAEFSASSYQWIKPRKGARDAKREEIPPHETARPVGLAHSAQRVLLDLELRGAEVNQQAMLNAGCAQVVKDLGQMLLLMSCIVDSFLFASSAPSCSRAAFSTCAVEWEGPPEPAGCTEDRLTQYMSYHSRRMRVDFHAQAGLIAAREIFGYKDSQKCHASKSASHWLGLCSILTDGS